MKNAQTEGTIGNKVIPIKIKQVFKDLVRFYEWVLMLGLVPSLLEPVRGYVQQEFHQMGGKLVVATDTGGIRDTVFPSGPKRNGYLFPRMDNWNSKEQDLAIQACVIEAVNEAKTTISEL